MGPRFLVVSEQVHVTVYNSLLLQTKIVTATLTSIPTTFKTLNTTQLPSFLYNITNAEYERIRESAVSLASPTALPGLLMLASLACRLAYLVLVWLLAKRLLHRRRKMD